MVHTCYTLSQHVMAVKQKGSVTMKTSRANLVATAVTTISLMLATAGLANR